MITSFFGLSRKLIVANKVRVAISVISVLLAVTLIVSITSLTYEMEEYYHNETTTLYGDMNIMAGMKTAGQYLNEQLATTIIEQPEIESASSVLIPPNIGIGNEKIESLQTPTVYSVGVENTQLAKSRYKFKIDIQEDEVVINNSLALFLNVNVHDSVKIYLSKTESKTVRVGEIVSDPKGAIVVDIAIFNIQSLQKWFELGHKSTSILLKTKPDTDNVKTASTLTLIDKNLRVDLIEQDASIQRNTKQIESIGYGIGVLAIIICTLLILSNFRLFISEYQRELAIIRAIGGDASQSFKLIFIQAGFIVLLGTVLGIGFAYGSSTFLTWTFFNLFGLESSGAAFPWLYAVFVAILCAAIIMLMLLIPVVKSTKILPLQAMRDNEILDFRKGRGKGRRWFALLTVIIGAFFIVIARTDYSGGGGGGAALSGLIGGILIVIGLFTSVSFLIKPIFSFLLPYFEFLGGRVAYIAIKNMISHTRRNTLVILSLAGAIAISITMLTIMQSIQISSEQTIKEEYGITDFMLTSRYNLYSTLKHDEMKKSLESIPGVEATLVYGRPTGGYISKGKGEINKQTTPQIGYTLVDFSDLFNMGLLSREEGDTRKLIFFSEKYADKLNIKSGETVRLLNSFDSDDTDNSVALKVITVNKLLGELRDNLVLVDWENTELQSNADTNIYKILIKTNQEENEDVIKGLNKLKIQYPEIKWTTLQEALTQSDQLFNQRFALFMVAAIIILLIGVFGTVSTLSSFIQVQRKEYAVLRAISLTPGQLFKMILIQSVLFCAVGSFVGAIAGIVMVVALLSGLGSTTIFLDGKLILSIITGVIGFALVFTLPIATRVCRKSVIKELTAITR